MNSPITGKEMQRRWKPVTLEFRGENFLISWLHYYCADTKEEFTDELLDAINLGQVYLRYALKHNMNLVDVIPTT